MSQFAHLACIILIAATVVTFSDLSTKQPQGKLPLLSDKSANPSTPTSGYRSTRSSRATIITALCPYMYYYCHELPAFCLSCDFNTECIYGQSTPVVCHPKVGVFCKLPEEENTDIALSRAVNSQQQQVSHTNFTLKTEYTCRYCHQLADEEVTCLGRTDCHQPNVPISFYETLCEASPHIMCMGKRVFRRMLPCKWSSGKSYVVTVFLSLLFGGFGVDRFYLGMWKEGLGKLLSFGGLGVWSVVDFVLILTGYLNPPGDAVYD